MFSPMYSLGLVHNRRLNKIFGKILVKYLVGPCPVFPNTPTVSSQGKTKKACRI